MTTNLTTSGIVQSRVGASQVARRADIRAQEPTTDVVIRGGTKGHATAKPSSRVRFPPTPQGFLSDVLR